VAKASPRLKPIAAAADAPPATPAWGGPAQEAKVLMVLGLLQRGPRHGYELHRVVVAHGSIYADLKKPTLYHLLERLARAGFVDLRTEEGARGPRGERLVYSITARGQAEFQRLLQSLVTRYTPDHMAVEMAMSFLSYVPLARALDWLGQRQAHVETYRAELTRQLTDIATRGGVFAQLSGDHLLALADAERAWVSQAISTLQAAAAAAGPGTDH
jgi:DNA-binding PadR family transcriptional regulator